MARAPGIESGTHPQAGSPATKSVLESFLLALQVCLLFWQILKLTKPGTLLRCAIRWCFTQLGCSSSYSHLRNFNGRIYKEVSCHMTAAAHQPLRRNQDITRMETSYLGVDFHLERRGDMVEVIIDGRAVEYYTTDEVWHSLVDMAEVAHMTVFIKGHKELWPQVVSGGVMRLREVIHCLIHDKHSIIPLDNVFLLPVNLSVDDEQIPKVLNLVGLVLQAKKVYWVIPLLLSFIAALLEFSKSFRTWLYGHINVAYLTLRPRSTSRPQITLSTPSDIPQSTLSTLIDIPQSSLSTLIDRPESILSTRIDIPQSTLSSPSYRPQSALSPPSDILSVFINHLSTLSTLIDSAQSTLSTPSDRPQSPLIDRAQSTLSAPSYKPQSTLSTSSDIFDVFINHRGKDVKKTIATVIFDHLKQKGLRVFLDYISMKSEANYNYSFVRSEIYEIQKIRSETMEILKKAIDKSFVHIVIFSPNYAESVYCLEELYLISKTGAPIIPVFHRVQSFELRMEWEGGVYFQALEKLKRSGLFSITELKNWKQALVDVSYIEGIIFEGDQGELLEKISTRVSEYMEKGKFKINAAS